MNVNDVLSMPAFRGARVIAGEGGLGRTVVTATVVEAPDIDVWGKEGQLLITSFYAFAGLDAARLADFFDHAAAIGVSGIVFKPERLVAEAPAAFVELCDERDLPLIEVGAATKYEDLLLDVLGTSLDANLALLNRFFDLHRQAMELALTQPTVLQVIMNLRSIIHWDITYFDATKDRRTTTSQELSEFRQMRLAELAPDRYRTHKYFDAELAYDGIDRRALAVLIPSSDDHIYYLVVHCKSERLAPLDIMAIGNSVSLLQMEVLKQNAIDRKLFFQNNNLVHDLLTNRRMPRDMADGALATLGIDQHPGYEVLLVRIDLADASEIDRRADVIDAVRRRLKMAYPLLAYYEANDCIAFLHNFHGEGSRFDMGFVADAIGEVREVPAMPRFTYLAALSGTAERYRVDGPYREVLDIARFFTSARHRDDRVRYEDLGVYKILMQAGDAGDLPHFIDPRAARLHDEHPDLFDTAVALCENSLNYQETARELFLHHKTIRYRAERAQGLSGLDLHDADDRLQLVMASRIYQLLATDREA